MNSCLVRRNLEQFVFSLPIRPLIADWRTASPRFITRLIERMEGFVEFRSSDWSVSHSAVVGDQTCRGRLFNGAASIILRPDELALNFDNVALDAYQIVFETLRRTLSLMEAEFSHHPYQSCNVTCVQHADAPSPESADAYLAQFSYSGTLVVLETLPRLTYEPSLRVVLPGANGEFRLQRTVEKSAARESALFISTTILFSKEMMASGSAPEMAQFFEEACQCADKAVGLEWEESA